MDNYQIIKQIQIISVLDRLNLQYRVNGNCIYVYKDWKMTNWRKGNLSGNYLNDFSHDRAKWWPFEIVKAYKKFDDKGTFQRFENNFWVWWDNTKDKIKKSNYRKRKTRHLPTYTNNW